MQIPLAPVIALIKNTSQYTHLFITGNDLRNSQLLKSTEMFLVYRLRRQVTNYTCIIYLQILQATSKIEKRKKEKAQGAFETPPCFPLC